MTNPIERGIIKDMYKIEDVYRFAFKNVLCLSGGELSEYGVICNCASCTPQQTAEELCELMMEIFNVKQFFISAAPVLSSYAVQKVSGLVIESGGGLTQCVPVFNGCPCVPACKRIDVGGDDIDEYLFDLLKTKYKARNIDMKICRTIKEKYGYIAIDYRKESAKKIHYEIGDGTVIKIGDERFKCGELVVSMQNKFVAVKNTCFQYIYIYIQVRYLYQPLSNINEIKERQKVVEIIINDQLFYTQLSLVFFFFFF